jgi:beta-phosphoglucomutase
MNCLKEFSLVVSLKQKRMSFEKEEEYQQQFKPHLCLLPGLSDFLEKAKANYIKMAIGSAAITYNIDFVLDNLNIRHYFEGIISADDVAYSKPHPETYLKCAEIINVLPANCIVFEDAPKGVESALLGGMKSIVITTMHDENEFEDYPNIVMFIHDYTTPKLEKIVTDYY